MPDDATPTTPTPATSTEPTPAPEPAQTQSTAPTAPNPATSTEPTQPTQKAADDPYAGIGEPPAQPEDWRQGMPEALRDMARDAKSMEDVQSALKRCFEYQPPKGIDDVQINFADGIEVDKSVNEDFRKLCVEAGITSSMAQKLADWQIKTVKESAERQNEACTKALQTEWGGRYTEMSEQAKHAVLALDRRMGGNGSLASALASSGAWNVPEVRKSFQIVGSLIGEDSLSGGRPAPAPDRPETPEETYSNFFK